MKKGKKVASVHQQFSSKMPETGQSNWQLARERIE